MNVPESRFPALIDAARQQTELVIWVAKTLQEHESRIDSLTRHVAALPPAASRAGGRASQSRSLPLASGSFAAAPGSEGSTSRRASESGRPAAQLEEVGEEVPSLSRELKTPAPQSPAPDEAESRLEEEEEEEEEGEEGEEEAPRGRSSVGSALEALAASARGSREIAPSVSERSVGEGSPPLAEEDEAGLDDDLELEPALDQAERAESRRTESRRSRDLEASGSAAMSPDVGLALLGRRMSSAAGGAELESQLPRRTSQSERAPPGSRLSSSSITPPAQLEQGPKRRSSARNGEPKPAPHPVPDGTPEHSEGSHKRQSEAVELEARIKASDELLIHAVEDLRKRVQPLEGAVGEIGDAVAKSAHGVKEVRLQSADLRMDLDSLQESVYEISSAVQSLEAAREKDLQARKEKDQRPPSEVPGDLESAREGLSVFSTEAGRSSVTGRRNSLPPNMQRPSKAGPSPMQAAHKAELSEEQLLMLEGLADRVAKLEAEAKAREERVTGDLEELVPKLEEKLEALEADYRGSSAAMQSRIELLNIAEEHRNEEDAKSSKVWNLANQVDVIQSVVSQEMRSVRADLLSAVKDQLQLHASHDGAGGEGGHGHHRGRTASIVEALGLEDAKTDIVTEVKDIDEKVRRLQDCYQQCTLKLAALKTASRHSEQQAGIAVDRVKRLGEEVEYLIERSYVWDCRLDYAALHHDGPSAEPQASPAKAAGGGDGPAFPRVSHVRGPHAARDFHSVSGSGFGAHLGDERHSGGPPAAPPQGGGGKGLRRHNSQQPRATEPAAPETLAAEPRGAEGGHPQGSPKAEDGQHQPHHADGKESDNNTSRIMRLGKKVSELDGEVHTQVKSLHEDLEVVSQKLGMITTFLPRRQRRIVERILAASHKGKDDEAGADDDRGEKKAEGPKRVQFAEKINETRTYHVSEEEHQVPWQAVGEPEQKWHWCLQPMTELGSALAQHFEQMEHEQAEFEQEVARNLEKLQEQQGAGGPRRAYRRSSGPKTGEDGDDGDGFLDLMSQDGMNALCNRVQKAVLPQLAIFEDRIERLVGDLREVKRQQEKDRGEKLDKAEFQLVAMRVAVFEKLDPKQLEERLLGLETAGDSFGQQLGQVAADQRRAEANSVHRNDFAKAKTEHTVLKAEHQKLQANVNELSTSIFGANKTLSTTITEAKTNFERAVNRLEKEKATMWEYSNLLERLNKLEGSMRDNRQILSGAGAQDVNAFVKRIILNMEDKLMVLEKKIDCLADGRPLELQGETGAPADPPQPAQARGSFSAQEGQVQTLGTELAVISQAMTQLKQEVYLSKVDMDHILEQSQLHADLAQRLNVYVEKAGADEVAGVAGGGEQGTVLSMNRVQVMISAAARQLVAGSKWVTKEIFDARFGEFRKEYLGTSRQLQAQLEELGGLVLKAGAGGGGAGAGAAGPGPKLPRMLAAKRQAPEAAPEVAEWPPSMPLDPGLEKQNRYLAKDRPPGTAPAQAGGGLGGPGPRRAGQQRPLTERGSSRDRAWAG